MILFKEFTMKAIEKLTFTDDYMFGQVMKDERICKGVIERLLPIKVDHVELITLQIINLLIRVLRFTSKLAGVA